VSALRARARRLTAVAVVLGLAGASRVAHAGGDTSYGRVEGDLELAPGAGVTVASYGVRPTLDLRARYLSMAGVFVTYEDSLQRAADPARQVATGVELRPLFVVRWLQGLESGSPTLDLLVDSFGLELGAFFAQPPAAGFGARMGVQASLGLELPLFAHAEGLFLTAHGGVRLSDRWVSEASFAGPERERAAFLTLGLAWHEIAFAGILR